jgi:Gluconate 2-dehydrogenase subunit 3
MAGRVSSSAAERLRTSAGGGAEDTPYPDFDVATDDKWKHDWDPKTRRLVTERVAHVPPYRFLTDGEARLLEAICDRLLPQDDRRPAERVPIAPWIDNRLAGNDGEGYRYAEMPPDPEAVRGGLRAIDGVAQAEYGRPFVEVDQPAQDAILGATAEGTDADGAWEGPPTKRWFQLILNQVLSFYYAHPAAWADIGFKGPSSPRGHMRLDLGRRDPWEAAERRPRSSTQIVRRNAGRGGGESGEATH